MKLKSLCLTLLVATSLISSTQSHSFDLSYKNIALVAGASIAGIAAGKIAYDYFFALTDAQEFENAIKLCEQSQELMSSIDQTYAHPTSVMGSTRYPLTSYAHTIQANINTLIGHENKLIETKIQIFERRAKLLVALTHASIEESTGIKSSIESYDFAIQELQSTTKNLKSCRKNLQKIKLRVTAHPQYIIEQQQLRIEELEKQALYNLNRLSCCPSIVKYSWEPSTVYVHNTHITNTTTVQQESPACPSRVMVTPSAPEPQDLDTATPCSQPTQEYDPKKKIKPTEDEVWRDRFCDIGDNFNG